MSFREPTLSAASKTVSVRVFAALQARIDTYQEAGGEFIPLQIGDTFLGPSPAVLAAASEPTGLSVYGAISGLPELRHVLAERLVESGHATVRGPSEVHVGVGCTHALFYAARAHGTSARRCFTGVPVRDVLLGIERLAPALDALSLEDPS